MKGVHRKYFEVAGITIEVRSDLPVTEETFHPKLKTFEVDGPGEDTVVIHHHFKPPELDERNLGEEIYRQAPWAVYQNPEGFVYLWIVQKAPGSLRRRVGFFNLAHTRGEIYNDDIRKKYYRAGGVESVTLFPTDQILVARLLGDRQGCILHSAGMVVDGKGLLFVGHSDAGKSTLTRMLKEKGQVLCDDRNIVRRNGDGFRLYGMWSHGDVPEVSAASAPLAGIFFLNQAEENRMDAVEDSFDRVKNILSCIVKPLATPDWWEKMLGLAEAIADEVPCYDLFFDRKGGVGELLAKLKY